MMGINGLEILSCFLALFAIIDVTGSIPIFLSMREKNRTIKPLKASVYSFAFLLIFLFVGEWILKLFHVDFSSFAIAGALVLLILSIEMIFGVEIFKYEADSSGGQDATMVPVVFPLIAGPGTFTTMLSMRSEYQLSNLILGIAINMIVVFVVLRYIDFVKKLLGNSGAYILRRIFGVILMAIAVRLFTANMSSLIASFQ